jgi:hypothetical protein
MTMGRCANWERLIDYILLNFEFMWMWKTMRWNTNRRRGRCRGIDDGKSEFVIGGFNSRGGGIDDGEPWFVKCSRRGRGLDDRVSRFGRGYDGSCCNGFCTSSWDLMDQALRYITSWRVSWYLDGSMSNSINLVFNIHRSSIFGSTRNTRRETFTDM